MKALAQLNIKELIPQSTLIEHTSEVEPTPQTLQKSVTLSFGTFVDHESLSLLISDKKIIKTWPTPNWTLLFVDQTERFAIFEADDSWYMAILDLQTGEWKEDLHGHLLHFSDDGESIIDRYHSIIHPFPEA